MRSYLTYFKLKFKIGLQYRAAAISGIITQIFFGLIYISIYNAFYESGSSNYPMPYNQLVSYVWLTQSFLTLIFMWYKDKELVNLIKSGNLAYELARPQDLYFMWYSKTLGERFSLFALRFIPVLLMGFILPYPFHMSFTFSFIRFLIFIITIFFGSLLMSAITVFFHVILIFTLEERGIVNISMCFAHLFAGTSIPIPFFPKVFQIIANILPFRYVSDLPFRLLVGNIPINEGLYGILIQIIWIIFLVLLGHKLMKIALNKAVIQGG